MLSAHSCPVKKLGAKDTGGMSVYVLELARELGKCGHLVDIYTRDHDPMDKQIYELGNNTRLIHLKAGKDGEMHKLAVYPHLPDFAGKLESFRKRNQLHYDLVYSNYWLSAWAGKFLQSWWNVPHIVMFHTLGAVKNAIGIGEAEPELRLETERYIARNCHRIIAATEREKEDLIQYYGASPETISVIPCGVNLDRFQSIDRETARQRLDLNGNRRNILFVGRIEPLKGIDKLLRAMTYLKNKHGLVALESLACGTPVVATDVGIAKKVIHQGETGYVVPDNSPHRLAQKIELLLSKPEVTTESIDLMRTSVADFDWSKIADRIVRECRGVLSGYST